MRSSLFGLAAVSLPLTSALAHDSKSRGSILKRNETTSVKDDDGVMHILGPSPQLPYDPNTTPYCTYWVDNRGQEVCEEIPDWWGIAMEDFLRWNPSITPGCGNFETGKSYCVEVQGEPPVITTTTKPTSTQPPPITTTTTAGNGITTPQPIQPGMVSNCNKFYFVETGDSCDAIARSHGITFANFFAWNPEVKSDCGGLWANVNVCVGVIGFTPSITTAPATTTTAGNGIATPTPIQPGMVSNCDAFHKVVSGDQCDALAARYGVTRAQLTTWNPEIGSGCNSMWLDYYICVSIIGVNPAPSTTTTGNGIATPTPIQPGMVGNCDAFHKVASGDECGVLASRYGVTVAQLTAWNPQIGSGCGGMWLDYYICVSIVGVQPSKTTTTKATTTTKGNGIATPTPYQEGMTRNCRIFRKVISGDSCASIAKIAGVTVAQFISWNPAVGSSCTNLWLNTYACIGLI